MTAGSGAYRFTNLRPSNAAGYTLPETQPAGFLDGKYTICTPGGPRDLHAFPTRRSSDLVSGANNDFGELLPASLSGFVYDDSADNDGVKQGSEQSIATDASTPTTTDDRIAAVNV